jgi:predicted RNase H-like HicB family nuclease
VSNLETGIISRHHIIGFFADGTADFAPGSLDQFLGFFAAEPRQSAREHEGERSADGRITVVSGRSARHLSRRIAANWYQGAGTMIRKYSLVIEGDEGGYSGYVPELPTILVTGSSIEELTSNAKWAVRLYFETLNVEPSPTSTIHEIEVELPA